MCFSKKYKKLLCYFVLSLIAISVYGQGREIQDSLIYTDPTVAKGENWVKGFSIDYFQTTKDGVGYDTAGGAHYQSTQSKQIGFSGFLGNGNFTLMFTRAPEKYTTIVPASGNLTSSTTINGSTYFNELIGRYLLTDYQNKYFVPYLLGGYAIVNDTQDMDVYVNNVREVNKTKGQGPGVGLGAIFPLTSKYGLRADVKEYLAKLSTESNLFSSFNTSRSVQYVKSTLTGYYNVDENINAQIGVQNSFIINQDKSSATGFYVKIGYTF
jgi:hypothetical protein